MGTRRRLSRPAPARFRPAARQSYALSDLHDSGAGPRPESRIASGTLPSVPKLSVTVIAKNEAADIGDALASVAFADETVVVDAHSTDETVAIARRHGARVEVRDWPGYSGQKNYAASIASHDWILSLDADERVTRHLAGEIRAIVEEGPRQAAFRIPRV